MVGVAAAAGDASAGGLEDARRDKHMNGNRDGGKKTRDDKAEVSDEKEAASAEAFGERPVDKLRERGGEEVGAHREVGEFGGGREVCGEVREARRVEVGGENIDGGAGDEDGGNDDVLRRGADMEGRAGGWRGGAVRRGSLDDGSCEGGAVSFGVFGCWRDGDERGFLFFGRHEHSLVKFLALWS